MNENGLLSNKDVSSRGDANSNYFRRTRNGVPVLNDIRRAHAFGAIDTNAGVVNIRNNLNVQSVVRVGPGIYTIVLSTGLTSARYAIVATIEGNEVGVGYIVSYAKVSNVTFQIFANNAAGRADPNAFSFAVYGIPIGPSSPPNQFEGVVANNGLITSTDLAATGFVDSNYYVNKNLITPLPTAGEVKAFCYVSNATPSQTASVVTIANSFNIDRIESAGQFNIFRVFLKAPLPTSFYTIVGTVGGNASLVMRTSRDQPGSFLVIINRIDAPTAQFTAATSFYFAIFRN